MAVNSNSPASRRDPMPSFCFKVQFELGDLKDGAEAFFRSVSGLKYETEVIDIRAGGVNNTTFRVPGATKWANIILKRGYSGTSALLDWKRQWMAPSGRKVRASGRIIQLDTALREVSSWRFIEAMPVKWEISDFDASKSEVSIETLELAHHGLE
ncbi:MAG: phage tail protein [Kofleriaceae bacterium]|nr:phage tail protein [Kofleriaceae bacterium]